MRQMRDKYKMLAGRTRALERLERMWWGSIEWNGKERDGKMWTGFVLLRIGSVDKRVVKLLSNISKGGNVGIT
jgi:hypothetical protein